MSLLLTSSCAETKSRKLNNVFWKLFTVAFRSIFISLGFPRATPKGVCLSGNNNVLNEERAYFDAEESLLTSWLHRHLSQFIVANIWIFVNWWWLDFEWIWWFLQHLPAAGAGWAVPKSSSKPAIWFCSRAKNSAAGSSSCWPLALSKLSKSAIV